MKNFCIAVLLVAMAGLCFAQAPQSSVSVPNTDVFVGYVMTSPDYGGGLFAYRLNGFEGAFSKGLTSHFAVVATGDIQFGDHLSIHATQFSGTVGGKYSFLTGRFRPYGIGQAGFAHQNSNGAYANDVVDGLTFRMGGGADLQLTPKLYWRIAAIRRAADALGPAHTLLREHQQRHRLPLLNLGLPEARKDLHSTPAQGSVSFPARPAAACYAIRRSCPKNERAGVRNSCP